MFIDRVTVGRVKSIAGEYGNRKLEMSAEVHPGEDAQIVAQRLAGYIDAELIAMDKREKAREEEMRAEERRQREEERRRLNEDIERRKLSDTDRIAWDHEGDSGFIIERKINYWSHHYLLEDGTIGLLGGLSKIAFFETEEAARAAWLALPDEVRVPEPADMFADQ
jgi:hypothetical protein